MDHIDCVLTTRSINNEEFIPSICAAANLAKKTLNRYYSLTDASDVYWVAMILHPRYKLDKNANWEEEWIEAAKAKIERTAAWGSGSLRQEQSKSNAHCQSS